MRNKPRSKRRNKPKAHEAAKQSGKRWQSSVLRHAVSKALSTPPEDERNVVIDALSGNSNKN